MLEKNIIISLIFKIYLLSLIVSINSSWSADSLANKFLNQSIVDPNNYFSTGGNEYFNIKNNIHTFEKEFKINVFIYMIDSMDYSSNRDPKLFTDQIAYKISGGILEKDKNKMILLMSISYKKNRIRI